MKKHSPPSKDKLLDCKYEGCGRTGAHGFKREDHRIEHYGIAHMLVGQYPWRRLGERESTSAMPTGKFPSVPELDKRPIPEETIFGEFKLREKGVSSKTNPQISRLSAEDSPLPESSPTVRTYAGLLDQECTSSKTTAPNSGIAIPEALTTENVTPPGWTAHASGEAGMNFSGTESWDCDDLSFCAEHEPELIEKLRSNNRETSAASLSRPQNPNDKLGLIKNLVLCSLAGKKNQYSASVKVQWDILAFMYEQFRDNEAPSTAVGAVVTISGSVNHSQATTCSEYVQRNWPANGSRILDALQDAMNNPSHNSKTRLVTPNEHESISDGTDSSTHSELEFSIAQATVCLNIKSSTPSVIVEIVQQLAWMGAALRTSANGVVQYCQPNLVDVSKARGALEPADFIISFTMSSIGAKDQSCWLTLFANPAIARGFPVPARDNEEQGLEIPLEIMAALGGARHVTDFEGGLILKGYSAMFVPVKRHHQSIQWHLIRHKNKHHMLYQEVNDKCPKRSKLDEVDYESLQSTRAFLGWWKLAETHLGTADAVYDSIDWSPAGEVKRRPTISGANIGFQTMITGQLSFSLGTKDGRLHFSQQGPFQKIMQCASKTPVALYDLAERRAWLVPCLDVILHIIQTRHHLSPYVADDKLVELAPVNPRSGRAAATDAIAANKHRQLYERDATTENHCTYKDAVLDIWSQIERLMAKEDLVEASPGLALHGTMQSQVYGWEYMSLVHGRNYRRKEAKVEKSNGGWVDLVGDIDALVLFATGLGEIIRPVSDLGKLCHFWRSLPTGKDFLAAGVPIMKQLYSEAGSGISRKHLSTSHLQWNRGPTLFEQCSGNAFCCQECDRTQQIYHDCLFKTLGHVRQPGNLEERGCVVFGQMHHPLKPRKKIPMGHNTVHMMPNISIEDSKATEQGLENADSLPPPSPTAHVSSEFQEVNGHLAPASKRPPLPLNFPDYLEQEEETLAKEMLNTQIFNSPVYEEDQWSKDQMLLLGKCGERNPAEQPNIFTPDAKSNRQVLVNQQTEHGGMNLIESMQAYRTVRRRRKVQDYSGFFNAGVQHIRSSKLNHRAESNFPVPENGTRRKSTNEGQPV